jgi:flagellar motor switch protein FliM
MENALIPAQQTDDEDSIPISQPMSRLPVELEVSVPVREFRVRHLLTLGSGQVIETQWAHDEDMPLSAGEVQLAWSEFEVVDSHLAVRLTRLA